MFPTAFAEENCVLDKPPQMTPDECEPLSVWRGLLTNGTPAVVSCWKPTKDELEEINKTGRIWLVVFGETMMPVITS